jgi:cell division control protein 45
MARLRHIWLISQIHTLILLSLGSLLPLAEYFKLPKGCHLHIIDSHRPWNLANLFGLELDIDTEEEGEGGDGAEGGRLWVWGDGNEQELGEVKKSWEALEVGPPFSVTAADATRLGL